MVRTLLIISAWASILALAFATLTDVGFVYSIYHKVAPLLDAARDEKSMLILNTSSRSQSLAPSLPLPTLST